MNLKPDKFVTRTIKQEAEFSCSPHEVFEALMNEKEHAQFTGSKTKIGRKPGEAFSIYGGGLSGKNMEVVKDKKIVQKWRCEMPDWPKHHYSTATFELQETGTGTKVVFTQHEVPEKCEKDIAEGWHQYYWKPMKEMLEKNK